eukprot:4844223-Amphidinium_carterae.1
MRLLFQPAVPVRNVAEVTLSLCSIEGLVANLLEKISFEAHVLKASQVRKERKEQSAQLLECSCQCSSHGDAHS